MSATAAIVTALGDGPASALDLSQRGTITKASRGVYRLGHCDTAPDTSQARTALGSCHDATARAPVHCNSTSAERSTVEVTPRTYTQAQIDAAVRGAWDHFEALNDPHNTEAWR